MKKSWTDSLDLLAILLILAAMSIDGLYAGMDYHKKFVQEGPSNSEQSAQQKADAGANVDSKTEKAAEKEGEESG